MELRWRRLMADVYEMMMKIGLHGGALTDLTIVAERLTRIHRLSEQVTSSFSRWHTALLGVGSLLAGTMIVGGIEKIINRTKSFSDELVRIQLLGGAMAAAAASGELTKEAFNIAQRVPLKVEDLLKIRGVVSSMVDKPGDISESGKIWERLAKYQLTQQLDPKFK